MLFFIIFNGLGKVDLQRIKEKNIFEGMESLEVAGG
jgi:hypothetical protein